MHMRIQLTPSGHYILGYHPDYQLNQNYIGINNLSIYRTVQSTLCLNRWYGLYHLICSSIFNGRNIFWTGVVSGELLHSEPASYQGCGACEPQSSSLWTAALTCDNAIQADQSAISWWAISESADHFISQLLWEAPELSLVISSGCNSVLEPFGTNHLSKLRLRFCFQPASS